MAYLAVLALVVASALMGYTAGRRNQAIGPPTPAVVVGKDASTPGPIGLINQRIGDGQTKSRPHVAELLARSATIPPFLDRYPSLSNRYRLRGVHYFQDAWPYTFWDSFRPSRLDTDFESIRSLGFNTIIVLQSWGEFQPRHAPPTYDEAMFKRLDLLIEAAARHQLWVVIRVGTPEHVPEDMLDASSYSVPDLMFNPDQINALADLFRETSRRVKRHPNVFGLFNSWEDFSQYLSVSNRNFEQRMAFEDRLGLFRAYLKQHRTLSEWNALWNTQYSRFEEIPVPAYGTLPMTAYVDFITEYIVNKTLSPIKVEPGTGLGYEARLDREPVRSGDTTQWLGYEKTFALPPSFNFLAAYFNPYWSAPNDGGFISPEQASAAFAHLLGDLDKNSELPVFFDQLNLADDTPKFTRTNSKLRYPDDEARAAKLILPVVFERTLGYSLWTFQDYVGNLLQDATFQSPKSAWSFSRTPEFAQDSGGERTLIATDHLEFSQQIDPRVNPGRLTPAPYRLDLIGFLPTPHVGPAVFSATLLTENGVERTRILTIASAAINKVSVDFGDLSRDLPVRLSVNAISESSFSARIVQVRLWNHLMATGIQDESGVLRESRALLYSELNFDQAAIESEFAVPARHELTQTCKSVTGKQSDCVGLEPDGWIAGRAAIPIHVPFGTGDVTFECFIPPDIGQRPTIELKWQDRPDKSTASFDLAPGLNRISFPLNTDSGGQTPTADRVLKVVTKRPLTIASDARSLGCRFVKLEVEAEVKTLGQPIRGRAILPFAVPPTNRLIVTGTVESPTATQIRFQINGHQSQSFWVQPGVEWQFKLPMFSEFVGDRPNLFIEVVGQQAAVTIGAITSESERTPNDVYR